MNKFSPYIILKRKWLQVVSFLVYDTLIIYFSFLCALYVSFSCDFANIPIDLLQAYWYSIPAYLALCYVVFWFFKLYNNIWRFVSYNEVLTFGFASILVTLFYSIYGVIYLPSLPLRYFFIGGWLQLWLIMSSRFFVRFLNFMLPQFYNSAVEKFPCMLIGAGAAGQIILRDILINTDSKIKVSCVIDDDEKKWGCRLNRVPIVGGRNDILTYVKHFNIKEIFLAIPSISAEEKHKILEICKESKCKLKTLPSMVQLVSDQVSIAKMKDVNLEDLLGREPISMAVDDISKKLKDKTVIVTGGGGSIGSELCRQIARCNPKKLIVLDIYENNAYDIEQELKRNHEDLKLEVLIGSVRDSRRMRQIFSHYRPDFVFHAAAHKHVPLMENSPYEAIKNNVFGTYKTAYFAMLYGCKRFVLISSDKAVNPTNIMGASKRLCEMIIQSLGKIDESKKYNLLSNNFSHSEQLSEEDLNILNKKASKTEFVSVRFGNVLGSNGSVVPLFKKQIEAGGPVVVTHPDIIRYFMTIQEAVNLVLQASTYAKGGEIFVLDMGTPMKIVDLARNLIVLSGYTPDIDIKINYSGLRKGEKLYEEKLMSEEGLQTTSNKLIHIAKPLEIDISNLMSNLRIIANIAYSHQGDIIKRISEVVGTYKPKRD